MNIILVLKYTQRSIQSATTFQEKITQKSGSRKVVMQTQIFFWSTTFLQPLLATIAQLLVMVEKLSFFESAISNFLSKKKNLASFLFISITKLIGQHGWDQIFMITMIFRKIKGSYRILKHIVHTKYFQFIPSASFLI